MLEKEITNSSAITHVAYDTLTKILRITFTSGGEYDYPDVPREEYENLVSAPSVGQYFNQHIKMYSVPLS